MRETIKNIKNEYKIEKNSIIITHKVKNLDDKNIYFSLGSLNSFIDKKRYLSANIIDNKLPNIFPKENNIKYKLPEVKKLINTGSIII